jgi:hypothetical protein
VQLERQTRVALKSVTSGPVDDGLCKTLCPAGNLHDMHAPFCSGAGRKEQQVWASVLGGRSSDWDYTLALLSVLLARSVSVTEACGLGLPVD